MKFGQQHAILTKYQLKRFETQMGDIKTPPIKQGLRKSLKMFWLTTKMFCSHYFLLRLHIN